MTGEDNDQRSSPKTVLGGSSGRTDWDGEVSVPAAKRLTSRVAPMGEA
jgi:hypothetical protein